MKFIVYLMTLLFVGTAIAQNPTILQGNYITNVFGNSNFVLNPNAQTSVANVTTVTATVSRSTTTPLVATSEFTVAIGTANGTATWATRAFDAGMKNNNCEARFTYRGFAATSKVHIKQGANTVASLTLTPATDPRIASINFPCGDLSAATTFQVTDTAILAGTNEIGGIYVGLATNMANVAQAEAVGGYKITARTTRPSTTSATFANLISGVSTQVVFGKATSSDAASGSVTFSSLPAGNYMIAYTNHGNSAASTSCEYQWFEDTSGIVSGYQYLANDTAWAMPTGYFEFTTAASRTFRIQGKRSGANTCTIDHTVNAQIVVYRFPSSSELVVTPERQNWYVSASHAGANPNLGLVDVTTKTEIIDASLTLTPDTASQPVATLCSATNAPPSLSTSATTCAAGSESLGITFNIPSTGAYEVCAQFASNVVSNANAGIDMKFAIEETATNANTALTNNKTNARFHNATSSVLNTAIPLRQCNNLLFSSIGQKAVRLMYTQGVFPTVTSNIVLADNSGNRAVVWTVRPLANQSNSALYVQGPVLASQTGAAIPASYVGEVKQTNVTSGITASNTRTAVTSIVLTPGVWRVHGVTAIDAAIPGYGDLEVSISPNATSTATWFNRLDNGTLIYPSNGAIGQLTHSAATAPVYVHYDGTNLTYLSGGVKTGSTAGNTIYLKVRTTYTTLYNQWHYMVAERIN